MLGLPPLDPMPGTAAVLLASISILAQAYGHEDFSATALVITIIASFFTLSGLLWIMHRVPI